MIFRVNNRAVVIQCATGDFIKSLDKRTAFFVKGHEFNPAFRRHWWDGKEHLVKKVKGKPDYTLPIGMMDRAIELANDLGKSIKLVDERRVSSQPIEVDWNEDIEPRDYQQAAVDALCLDRGLLTGKGMIRVPTRGGKTLIAARTIHKLQRRALFIVPSQLLQLQTVQAFERMLMVPIGQVGDGVWAPEDITVASIQTLAAQMKKPRAKELLASFDVVFFDECHHFAGEKWRRVFDSIDALYKIGLSATIFLKDDDDNELSGIHMVASTGPVLYSIEPDELILRGFLVRPTILCVKIREPEVKRVPWPTAHLLGIVQHGHRNDVIARLALNRRLAGRAVLVITASLDHTADLKARMMSMGLVVGTIIGSTPAEERRTIIERYNANEVDVLLGTVFGEGIDIPRIEVVINAEGGKSQISSTQKFRNITPSPGKETAEMIDFMDLHNKYLAGHSLERLQTYREHAEFRFKVVEVDEIL